MARYELHFWDGSLDEVEADSISEAKEKGKEMNDCGVKRAVLVEGGDDDDDQDEDDIEEDDNPADDAD